ncbi:MAG: epoxyqueuosine reductase [Lachnospiraceae bacterium]|nr:epoxyqueuosine reductase [Lachnospiraceae bacterium]
MDKTLEKTIEDIITEQLLILNRPDLYRSPLVSFSSADDKRYKELKNIIGEWHLTPKELLPEAESIISYFVPFTKDVASEPKKIREGSPLWGEAYQEINKHFNIINDAVSNYLIGLGYQAKAIKPTHTYDPKDLKSLWSHRSAASIAGLGNFAANRLLITEKGSAGRFCTVITSAPLKADNKLTENKCLYVKNKSCGLCFKICPVKALAGDGSFDKFACQKELNKNEEGLKKSAPLKSADICGKCISICPFAYIA